MLTEYTKDIVSTYNFAGVNITKLSERVSELEERLDKMVSRDCDYLTTLILCIMLGAVGGHRFYTRKFGTAVLMILLTCFTGIGGLIWSIIDLVSITRGEFTTIEGSRLTRHPRWDY